MSTTHLLVTLKAAVVDNRLVVTFEDQGEELPLRADSGLEDIRRAHPSARSITLEVHDFYQNRTVYQVYAVTLAADGHRIAEHWRSVEGGNGKRCTFSVPGAGYALPAVVIGAVPQRSGMHEPVPLEPVGRAGHDLPINASDPAGQTGGN